MHHYVALILCPVMELCLATGMVRGQGWICTGKVATEYQVSVRDVGIHIVSRSRFNSQATYHFGAAMSLETPKSVTDNSPMKPIDTHEICSSLPQTLPVWHYETHVLLFLSDLCFSGEWGLQDKRTGWVRTQHGIHQVIYAKQQNTKYKNYCLKGATRRTILILCLYVLTNLMSFLSCPT